MDGNNMSKLKDKQQQKQKSMEMISMNTNNNINNSSHSSSGKATNTIGTGTVNINAGGTSSSSTNKPKEKRRSNEKRKEKSRDAARCRRSRETEIFAELANVLPIRREDVEQLDKASIMRLSIAFLKVREMLKLFPKLKDIKIEKTQDDNNTDKKQKIFDILDGPKSNKLLTQSMDGFLLILSSEGDVTYVSENISEYLGISQIDILGQQIWEYSHQCDHDELKEALNMRRNNIVSNDLIKSDCNENNNEENDEKNKSNKINMKNIINENLKTDHRDFYIRLKCTLTSRGRSVNIKSASYKVIHMTGHIIMNNAGERILVAIGRPLPHPSNIEIPLGSTTFLTKHSLDMKFTYADDNMLSLLGYKPEDLLNKSLYDYHYAVDSESLMATFKSVLSKGQCETNRYRFLGKYGGYSWVVTQATIVYDKQKPQSVVCVNYALSNLENDNEIYSCEQLEASNNKKKTATTKLIQQQQQQQQQQQKKLEDKQFDRILEQKKSIPCELLSTGKSAQNNFKLSPTAIKTNVIKSPIKLTSDTVNLKENNKILNQTELEKNCYQQQQQQQQQKPQQTQQQIYLQQQQQQQKYLLESNKTRILQTLQNIDNNIKSADLIKCENLQSSSNNNQLYRESSLSPIRHTFNKCSINSPTSILRGDNIQYHSQQQKPITQRGGPKTVTATVFKKVSIPPTKLNFSSASIIGGGTGSGILNRPQSVTASVLTPISSLSKVKQNSSKFSFNNCNKTQIKRQQQQQINHNQLQQQQQQQLRTEDMNKGFSMFLDDPPELTMLKEEPDDLTHLAPTAGDTCLPLDDSTPLFGEMLDSLILPDTYGTLLSDDINSLDSQQSTNNNSNNNNNNNNFNCNITNNNNSSNNSLNNKSHIDPFINYRDESSDTTGSPHLLSPGASKSPEVSSIPSLCSPNSLSQDDEFAFMTMNDEIDLTMRAPYIPMNEQDDLPLLTEDLMWSAFSEELHKDIKEALQIEIKNNINNNINNNNNNNNMNLNISCNSINSSNNNNNNLSCINDSNNSNNNIESNNETSSLAALLCNATTTTPLSLNSILNQQHQQQQQQQQQSQLQQNTRTSSPSSPSSLSVSSLLGQITTNNELSKKRKYEMTSDDDDNLTNDGITTATTTVPSADLVDTIDAFGQVFNNKNSPNIDCWTINDLLQISPLSSGSTTATTISGTTFNNQNSSGLDTKHQQQHQQNNIIVNTATIPCTTTATATFHVPLITFQHNGNKINLTRSSSIGSINGCNTTTKNGIGIGINIDEQLQQQQCNNKKSNITKILTATSNNNTNNTNGNIAQVLNKSSNININITTTGGSNSSNVGGNEITTVTLPQQITTGNSYNNKRHLNISTSLDSKRVKNSSSIEIQTSPTLLQQLMAPTLQKHKGKSTSDKSQNSRWHSEGGGGSDDGGNTDDGNNNVNGQQRQQQNIGNNNNNMSLSSSSSSPSHSVLKNLLVSGCDGVFSSNQKQQKQHHQSADDVMMIDDNSLDSMNDSYQHLKLTQESNINNYAKPLQCKISNPNLTLNETSILSANNNLLHYFGSNPMIGGGPGLLPSPPIPILLDSSTENKTKNNMQVTTNSGDNFNLSVDGGGGVGGVGSVRVGGVGGNQHNYRNETNYRVMNNSPSSNYMMAMHSPKLMAFNDSDSDSGIECGGGGIGRSNNFGRNFLTRSSTTDKITSKLTQESPTKNPIKITNLQPNIDCDLYNDDSMSLSGDEAPPPLEPTDFILESSAILTPAILSPTPPAGSCLSSPKLMTTAINKPTIISPNHNDNNNPDIKLSPNSPYSPSFNVETAVNPLANSSFLMDLCSDDYAMSDLLQDNEITKVLNDWNTEMT